MMTYNIYSKSFKTNLELYLNTYLLQWNETIQDN